MSTEFVFNAHDNYIGLILKSDGTALTEDEMDLITKITATFNDTLVSSEDKAAGPIRWRQTGYAASEIRLYLGDQSISAGKYRVPIIVYDATNDDGIVWDIIDVVVRDDVEASE